MPADVLFVCVHNAGRSVMAEAIFNRLSRSARAASAGTAPRGTPHPAVVEAMAEIGIDVSAHRGTVLTDNMVRDAGRVITMGCAIDADACPAIQFAIAEDWSLSNPKGKELEDVRIIRDEIESRVAILLAEIRLST